jgi:chemotaxis protein MotB
MLYIRFVMKNFWIFLFFLPILGPLTSCVGLKRHKELERSHQAIAVLNDSCQAKQIRLTGQLDVLEQRFNSMQKVNQGLMRDTARLNSDLKAARQRIEQLDQQNNELARTSDILRKGSAAEQDQLLKELRETEATLRKREEDLALLEKDVRSREARIQEMQSMMDAQAQTLNNLRQTISKALLGFEESGLTVREQNGRVYVSLSEKLMFKVGSADVDPRGRQAIQELGKVLAGNPDINIMVEGHTDDQGGDALNWDLSVRRATSIVKILVENPQIEPHRITAAGRGKHLPLEQGKSNEARTRNRRTEIILTPQLDLLFQWLETR